MPTMQLITALLEQGLNRTLWRDRGLKHARQGLQGSVLTLNIFELGQPLVLHFSEQQIDVLSDSQAISDCSLSLSLTVIPVLRDRNNLMKLIKSGQLEVVGDLQVLQRFSALIDLAEFDLAEYLTPWTGDLLAQTVSQLARQLFTTARRSSARRQRQISEAIVEEWRLVPGALEQAWFCGEVEALSQQVSTLDARLAKLENL